uniref:Uncharacterized protein n=1 Tax=Arundo donax TaxID=35708 RepID=A0A0A8ZWG4_ARUDO
MQELCGTNSTFYYRGPIQFNDLGNQNKFKEEEKSPKSKRIFATGIKLFCISIRSKPSRISMAG